MAGPWVETYRPQALDAMLGNPQALAALRNWAQEWQRGTPKLRAAILAGPPGCGKTTAAHALAHEFGWGIVELNASDARNAGAIQRVAGVGAIHQTFSLEGEFQSSRDGHRKLIILDEADNLYERAADAKAEDGTDMGDRGGKRAIVDTITSTQQPIILIVNDAYALSRGSGSRLAKLAVKVPFRRLTAPTVRKALDRVAHAEGLQVNPEALQAIASRAQGDLRGAINDLQALAAGQVHVSSLDAAAWGDRNRPTSAFDAMATILKRRDAGRAIAAARELDETPDFVLLWLDENVPREYTKPEDLARAMDRLSRADIFLGRAMRRQQFSLWGYATEVMAGGVSAAKDEPYRSAPRYQFPGYLRRMSSSRGARGTRDALAAKIGAQLHMGKSKAVRDVVPQLRKGCQASQGFAEQVAIGLELDEDELRYLLGPDAEASMADEVVERVERRRQSNERQALPEPDPEEEDKDDSATSARQEADDSGTRPTSLGDF